jgi:hypothetical protein
MTMARYAAILFRASAGFKTPNKTPKAVTIIAIVARDPMIEAQPCMKIDSFMNWLSF